MFFCHLTPAGFKGIEANGGSLALAEMKTLLREVYSRFRTTPDLATTAADMEMSDQLISSRPAGQRCLLRFEAVEQ